MVLLVLVLMPVLLKASMHALALGVCPASVTYHAVMASDPAPGSLPTLMQCLLWLLLMHLSSMQMNLWPACKKEDWRMRPSWSDAGNKQEAADSAKRKLRV